MSYYLNSIEELTEDKILKIIRDFRLTELPRLQHYKDYYEGDQAIMYKTYTDESKPCNRVVVNHCYSIVTNYKGFIVGKPVTYASDEDISDLNEILFYNDVHNEDNDLLESALVYGISFEVNYLDSDVMQRFKTFDSRECIPVYSSNLEEEVLAVIRMYSANDLDDVQKAYVDVYTDKEIRKYATNDGYNSLSPLDVVPHYYGMVPVTVFKLNNEAKSIFDRILTLQDSYNELISSSVDDVDAWVDAYLLLVGYDADSEDIKKMKEDRVLLVDESGAASFLTKDSNGESRVKWLLDEIKEEIQKIACCPDFLDETFGAQSGIAIQYRLIGMENQAASIESAMKKALLRRIELINQIQRLTVDDLGWSSIDIIFTRNLPYDTEYIVNIINSLRGMISEKTLISQLPFIKDVDKELEQLAEEKAQEQPIIYDFNYGDEE